MRLMETPSRILASGISITSTSSNPEVAKKTQRFSCEICLGEYYEMNKIIPDEDIMYR